MLPLPFAANRRQELRAAASAGPTFEGPSDQRAAWDVLTTLGFVSNTAGSVRLPNFWRSTLLAARWLAHCSPSFSFNPLLYPSHGIAAQARPLFVDSLRAKPPRIKVKTFFNQFSRCLKLRTKDRAAHREWNGRFVDV